MLNHLSLRNNVAGSVLVMGVLGILLAVLIAETNREYAIDNQRAGFEQIIGLRAETLLDELAKVSHDLGQALQGDKKFRAFLKNKDATGLDEHLQSQFHQYFVTAGIIKLESLAVYDNQFNLFSRAISEGASVDATCPDLHVRAAKRTGAYRTCRTTSYERLRVSEKLEFIEFLHQHGLGGRLITRNVRLRWRDGALKFIDSS